MEDHVSQEQSGWRGSRDGWLDAAREALIERGIGAVKIQPLAQALNLSRTSFYWFFKDRAALLDALLQDWEATNTSVLERASEAYAETVSEAALNVIAVFLRDDFEARLDSAIRGWAHESEDVAQRVTAADERRLAAITRMFGRFGFDPTEADVRARTIYLVQIGYIAMQTVEPLDLRIRRIPSYVKTYTGKAPSEAELARFEASVRQR